MQQPLFSIVTICRNAAANLARTIASVDSQTFGDYEHIIIDGASTDDTSVILEVAAKDSKRIIISEPDKGIYDAMNKGLGYASGEYLIFMNAGDMFHSEDSLQLYAECANDYDRPGIIYGQTLLVDQDGNTVGERHLCAPEHLTYRSFSQGMLVCHQAMAVLKRIAPLYNTKYRFSADYDWVIKCLQHSRLNVYTGHIMCNYLSEGMTTANRRASLLERFRIMTYYYGFLPTALRHLGFARRFMRYKSKTSKKK
ncbi:MAG: glycosyltransferase [Muribaculaceae bacterium]|nr:glycosyltransferase [Muribaculaceae bacterium]